MDCFGYNCIGLSILIIIYLFINLPILPQTKNPTDVGLDVVERVNLFQQYHLLGLPEFSCLYRIKV